MLSVTATAGGLSLLTTTDAEHRASCFTTCSGTASPIGSRSRRRYLVKANARKRGDENALVGWQTHRDTPIKPSSRSCRIGPARRNRSMNDSRLHSRCGRQRSGVSLRNSSVWIGPNATLQAFEVRAVRALLFCTGRVRAKPTARISGSQHACAPGSTTSARQKLLLYFPNADPKSWVWRQRQGEGEDAC